VDVSTITDLTQLKAMAYDELRAKAIAESNLSVLTNRIQQIEETPPDASSDVSSDE
jgi:hypothetical protein